MQKIFDTLTTEFKKNSGFLSFFDYEKVINKSSRFFEESDTIYLLLQASGYPIEEVEKGYRFLPAFTPYLAQKYCIIDIETNGSKPCSSQVIEIGAVMVQNGKIIDKYETFVSCTFLPNNISRITGIELSDLLHAPSQKEALIGLRHFMEDTIFVAHNVDFDYGFLNASFERFGLGNIGNPKLCTIELARRTFESERYGLAHLIEFLEIETATHHRALSDALCSFEVMKKSLKTLPSYVKTTEELVNFSFSSRKERRLKKQKS